VNPIQEQKIKQAWAKLRDTKKRLGNAAEQLKNAGLAQADQRRMYGLDSQYQAAVNADSAALDELESALRDVGIDI
jgi:division protein CdvB (Snf7/Vps24/ESCRT-III family)